MSFLSAVKDYLSIAIVENNRLLRENVLLKERIAQLERRPTQDAADGAFTSAQILKVLDVSKEQRKRFLKRTPRH